MTDDDYASSQDLNLESNSQNDGNSGGPRGSSETSGSKSHQPKAAYCDSCDSDDYADSDNWIIKFSKKVLKKRRKKNV